jgi:hypothetical protein
LFDYLTFFSDLYSTLNPILENNNNEENQTGNPKQLSHEICAITVRHTNYDAEHCMLHRLWQDTDRKGAL